MAIAIIASQSRLVQVMEKLYGDDAFNNTALAEYKRAIEALEKESKDNLVSTLAYSSWKQYIHAYMYSGSCLSKSSNGASR